MTDIHCHILPAVDDGAKDVAEALQMASLAVDSGVDRIIATPHLCGTAAAVEADIAPIEAAFSRLKAAFAEQKLPVRLYLGAEVLCLPETPALAKAGLLPTLAGTDYLLTEFCFDEPFEDMDERLLELAAAGFKPVVAHPERYICIHRDPFRLVRWFNRGVVLQLNKGSILGAFGSAVRQTSEVILDAGLAHVIAGDAHHADRRTPYMREVRRRLEALCPPEYVDILLEENPLRILNGQAMVPA